jgi:PKD repeat protein
MTGYINNIQVMKKKISFSKSIDPSVILTMTLCVVVGLAVLGLRYKNYEPYTPIPIIVKSGSLYAGELIQFRAATNDRTKKLSWDFGDNTRQIGDGMIVSHKFSAPGRYEVRLTTDQNYVSYKTIYVTQAPLIASNISKPQFRGPLTAIVGVPVVFKDSTANATTWEWRFGETNKVDATKQRVSYTFKEAGNKKVILVVNGTMQGELTVYVKSKFQEGKEQPKSTSQQKKPSVRMPVLPLNKKPEIKPLVEEDPVKANPLKISSKEIKDFLIDVVEGRKTASDLSNYLCEKENTPVVLNGNQGTFHELCQKLKQIKKANKIKSLDWECEKDTNSTCIQSMKVNIKLRAIEGIIPGGAKL